MPSILEVKGITKYNYQSFIIKKCNFEVSFVSGIKSFVEGAVHDLVDAPPGFVHFTDRVADEFCEVILKVFEHLRRVLGFCRWLSYPLNNFRFECSRVNTFQIRAGVFTD